MKIQLLTAAVMLLLFTGCATTDDAKSSSGKDLDNVSIKKLQKQATKGSAEAQVALSDRYRTGTGVEKDEAKAFEWAEKVANTGNANGMLQVAKFYTNGVGVEKSPIRAIQWTRKAANKGTT